ncbi:MAG TPA: thiolase domain-containing protein [Candidatus Diapherotrites archaeon]|uniref:Thiolase domain-containing protein n=1 Tax=Candidatus Iainarchaeum sp. TaxID=3101447 RepID=A0A7J4J2Q8_9ARCH|nr:thiolase domain-containing protein [Candidatus Diapherotrites archaeon]
MRGVSIVGAGQTSFGEHWEKSFKELIAEAGIKAIDDSGLARKDIQAVYGGCMASGRFIGQEHIGALIADQLGLNPIPSTRLEAACASGGVALRNGYIAVASGLYDIVAVGGIEKMTEVSTEDASFALGGAGDQETELFMGATFPALYALMARSHMKEFGTTEEQMASVSVKNHKNAVHNPFAQFRTEITVEQVMQSGYVASPLKLLDCSPISDGAAAVILCASDVAKKMKMDGKAVEIIASTQASDTLALAHRHNLYETRAAKIAADQAYKQAGIKPADVSFAEAHDCFSAAEIMAIEALGFCKQGEGGKFTEQGNTALNGAIPVNTSGGLKACGHPVAATGVKQAIEAYLQLNEMAGKRQVRGAETGLTHNVGGSGATAVVHIYRRL